MTELARRLPPLATLVAFEAAYRHGSFTRAAEELALSQASISRRVRELEQQAREQVQQIDEEVAESAIKHCFSTIHAKYETETAVTSYLEQVHDNVLASLNDFAPIEEKHTPNLRRYEINLLVDRTSQGGVQGQNLSFALYESIVFDKGIAQQDGSHVELVVAQLFFLVPGGWQQIIEGHNHG